MTKVLTFISTHIINNAVVSEYKKMITVKGYDCILAIDNTNLKIKTKERISEQIFFGTKIKCFFFDSDLQKELQLPWFSYDKETKQFSDIMWYNSDYRFYYIKKYFPNYDYYWQFEYDIFCNGKTYQYFFDKYKKQTEDCLCLQFRKEKLNGKWFWSKSIKWIYGDSQIYAAFFPIVRLSNKAIELLYNKRLEHKKLYKNITNKEKNHWPFCEVFLPTEIIKSNLSVFKLNEDKITYEEEYDLNESRLFEHPDNLLYHPVKGNFIERENKLKKRINELEGKRENKLLNIKQLIKKVLKIKKSKNY